MRFVIIFLRIFFLTQNMHLFRKAKEHFTKERPVEQQSSTQSIEYPVRFTYVNRIQKWWPPESIAAGLGVPGFAKDSIYNYFALAFWTYANGPLDTALIWADPIKYLGADSVFGSKKEDIQKSLRKKYNDAGVKILISAFGSTEFPTTAKVDPVDCAEKLASFVINNQLDGVDVDWEDNPAMEAGTGQHWLINFQSKLRSLLPNHIISHAPQAPYFNGDHYKNGGYQAVNKYAGSTIDFYNIQFYNQGNNKYDTYDTLFLKSGANFPGTSVKELIQSGIHKEKIVVGKPASNSDAANTGMVKPKDLGDWVVRAYKELGWFGGVMFWQYFSDSNGKSIQDAAGFLLEQFKKNKNCK